MDTIVFVDHDSKWLANYKRILTPFQEELDCVYFHHSEEAMEYMSSHPTKVLVSELDMPVMSGRELFEMMDLLSPATVKIGMTQVRNVADTLNILNQIKIHKLILKPFFLAEDLIVPIRAALEHYKEETQGKSTMEKAEKKLQELNQEAEKLQEKMADKKQKHDRVLQAMLAMAEADLSFPVSDFDPEKKEKVKKFCTELLQEFFQYYTYEKRNLIFYLSYLKNRFHRAGKSCIFGIKNKVSMEIPVTVMNRIAYATFLTGFLCETCLESYHVENLLEAEGDEYVLQIWYDWQTEAEGKEKDPEVRKLYENIIRGLEETLSDRMAEKTGERGRALKLYFRREEGRQ